MARKYGGQTGPFQSISNSSAPGSWISGTEVYRQRQARLWPKAIAAGVPAVTQASVVYTLGSGVADEAVATNLYTLCSGGITLSRITYASLFAEIGESFGEGDGSTTFNVPTVQDRFIYARAITTSGTSAATVHESGSLGTSHNHTFFRRFTNPSPPRNLSQPKPRRQDGLSTPIFSSFDGEGKNNEARAHALVPVFAIADATMPIGAVFPILWPDWNYTPDFPAGTLEIASGQALSRTGKNALFNAIGTHWGAGDGSTTFNIPDMRGLFIKGLRDPAAFNCSGIAASASGDPDCYAIHRHNFPGGSWGNINGDSDDGPAYQGNNVGATTPSSSTFTGNANESRPSNIGVIWVVYVG